MSGKAKIQQSEKRLSQFQKINDARFFRNVWFTSRDLASVNRPKGNVWASTSNHMETRSSARIKSFKMPRRIVPAEDGPLPDRP